VPHLLSAREAEGVKVTRPSAPARHDFRIYPGNRHRLRAHFWNDAKIAEAHYLALKVSKRASP